MRLVIIRVLCLEAPGNFFEQGSALIQNRFPEATVRCFPPVIDRGGHALSVNQPEQAGREDVAEFLVLRALWASEGLVTLLPHCTADRDLADPQVVNDAEPVLMIDGLEESIEPLRIDEQRTARDEWYLHATRHAARVSHD